MSEFISKRFLSLNRRINNLNLFFIRTDKFSFIVDDSTDDLRRKLGIVFGKSIKLFCEKRTSIYKGKQRIVYFYSDYISERNIQICKVSSIIEKRKVNDIENGIFNRINNNQKLNENEKNYLKSNFSYEVKV